MPGKERIFMDAIAFHDNKIIKVWQDGGNLFMEIIDRTDLPKGFMYACKDLEAVKALVNAVNSLKKGEK